MSGKYWTDPRKEEIRILHDEGCSLSQMSDALGGISREAIRGALRRMGRMPHKEAEKPILPKAIKAQSALTTPERIPVFWNPETILRLSNLYAEGLSSSQIGKQMGRSRNAIIGKIHRLGINRPGSIFLPAARPVAHKSKITIPIRTRKQEPGAYGKTIQSLTRRKPLAPPPAASCGNQAGVEAFA